MAQPNAFPLVAVDIGNSRIKLGEFEHPLTVPLPHPIRTATLKPDWTDDDPQSWLPRPAHEYAWSIASVNRPTAARLLAWLTAHGVGRVRLLAHADLPLKVELPRPEQVGIDRLATALAARHLRTRDEATVVINLGSAITVDLVSARGAFLGGAILPGIEMSARALHEFTDLLPLVEMSEAPERLGRSTIEAVRFGVYWGAVGALRELIARLTGDAETAEVFLTGGNAPAVAAIFGEAHPRPLQLVPHLTLAGVALAESHGAEPEPQ
jgi:type III pantothenate kinase